MREDRDWGCRVDKRARVVDEMVDHRLGGTDERARQAQCLAASGCGCECLIAHTEVLDQSLTVLPEDTRRMGLVHDEKRVVLFTKLGDSIEWCDVPVHAEK